MGLQRCHIQDPFASCTFNFNQPNKLLVSHARIFYYTFITSSQTISELCILTIKFTFSKRKYHSLQFGSTGNWSSLWAYNTSISMTLFSLQFILYTTKHIVSLSCIHVYIYLYSKPCILTVHHIYINMKRESHSLPMPHFNIPNLSKRNSTFQRI
jgi:hypothetical protein